MPAAVNHASQREHLHLHPDPGARQAVACAIPARERRAGRGDVSPGARRLQVWSNRVALFCLLLSIGHLVLLNLLPFELSPSCEPVGIHIPVVAIPELLAPSAQMRTSGTGGKDASAWSQTNSTVACRTT